MHQMTSLEDGQSFCRFGYLTLSSLKSNGHKPKKDRKLHRIGSKIINLILGIAAVIVALPFLIIIFILSKIVPQEQWEKFWDEFWDDYRDLP